MTKAEVEAALIHHFNRWERGQINAMSMALRIAEFALNESTAALLVIVLNDWRKS